MTISHVKRPKEAARANYDRLSRWYDWFAFSERKYRNLGLAKLHVCTGEQVLDVGFGTGHSVLALAKCVGDEGLVTGLDLSPQMMRRTAERLHATGLSYRADLYVGDAAQMPFTPNSFDAVFMSFTLELFDTPEIPVVLAHCWRVLRENGRLCIVSLLKESKPGYAVRLYEWMHEKLPTVVDCRPIFVSKAIRDAGFSVTAELKLPMWGLPVAIVCAEKTRGDAISPDI
ncbi:MAG: methyltransferase domain-containing protein [Anaerolineales bacterium]|nr:methyltransferase domain-containing protein [Anaerolineales bacterium]